MNWGGLALNPAGSGDLATPPAVDHRFRQPWFAFERPPVMRSRRSDDLALAAEDLVAEFQNA